MGCEGWMKLMKLLGEPFAKKNSMFLMGKSLDCMQESLFECVYRMVKDKMVTD